MKNKRNLILVVLLIAAALFTFLNRPETAPEPGQGAAGIPAAVETKAPSTAKPPAQASRTPAQATDEAKLDEDGLYSSKEDVALYLFQYGKLPVNFITKQEARGLGWPGGDLRPYAEDKTIGGDRFGNYEGRLPEKRGRTYYECDIDTLGRGSRGARRLVYSNDGLIYYTDDHYGSFTLLYGED